MYRFAAEADTEESKLVVAGKPADAARTVRDGEIRSWSAAQDRATQTSVVASALAEKDFDTFNAFLSAPKAMRLLPDQIAQHLKRQMLEMQTRRRAATVERKRRVATTSP